MFLLLSGVKSSVLNTGTLADFEVRSEKCGIVLAQWKCASLERPSHSAQRKGPQPIQEFVTFQAPQLTQLFHDINIFITFASETRLSARLFMVCFFSASNSGHFNFRIAAMFTFNYCS